MPFAIEKIYTPFDQNPGGRGWTLKMFYSQESKKTGQAGRSPGKVPHYSLPRLTLNLDRLKLVRCPQFPKVSPIPQFPQFPGVGVGAGWLFDADLNCKAWVY